ncbi:URC1, partial [Symbiodinium pilosum]
AAWSKPSGFRQCINWCRGVLDLVVEDDFLSSPRVVGICKGMESRAPPPKRAPCLTFEEVLFIEALAAAGENVQDVVIAGAVLFMLFASARASDAARAVSLYLDFSDADGSTMWMESEVKKSKTAMGARDSASEKLSDDDMPADAPLLAARERRPVIACIPH